MKKLFFVGIALLLVLGVNAVISPSVWTILNAGGTAAVEIGIKNIAGVSRSAIPGPQEISGIGYSVQANQDTVTGALTPGQKTFQTYKVKKLTKPFVDLAAVPSNRTSALDGDRALWNWAQFVYSGQTSGMRETMDVIHYKESGGGTPSSSVRYNLTNSWPNSWQLDTITQGQQGPMTETYTFVYEGIQIEP